jgi:N-succinyldiaminopimelate aminotransferase
MPELCHTAPMAKRLPRLTARLQGLGTSIFAEMTALALQHQAVNLGQGFPDFDGPEFVKDAAIEAIRAGKNQYCRTFGLPELNRAIAGHQERFYGLAYDPDREVTVYAGATEALACALQALLDVGDEVVLFEPYYDSYPAGVAMAGARARVVTLHPPDFTIDEDELRAAVSPRTRAILVNSPSNPSGKVFRRQELELVAEVCRAHDLVAISDEVYEHITFGVPHLPLASLPGMRERTVAISSAGKTFSFTGWKIGWSCAPPDLTAALRTAHQFVTFCNNTPQQHAIAAALGTDDAFYASLGQEYLARRDRLCRGLRAAGLSVLEPDGTYFALVDIRGLGTADGDAFCRELPARARVAAIPVGAFCESRALDHLVRFAFCKTDAVIDEGMRRLAAWSAGAADGRGRATAGRP